MTISAIIKLEEDTTHLPKIIESLEGFDEIVICDLGVNPQSIEYARSKGCRIIPIPESAKGNINIARDTALHSAKSPWALLINENELVTPQLRKHLYEFIKNPDETHALYIPRRNFLFDRWSRHSYPDYQMRFVHVESTKIPDIDGALAVVKGKIGKIPANHTDKALIRISPTVTGIVKTLNSDTTVKAEEDSEFKITLRRIILRPWWKFFKSYFINGLFRYGIAGYVSARNEAFFCYVRLAKIYEMQIAKRRNDSLPK